MKHVRRALCFLIAAVAAANTFGEVRWTYENGVLTEIASATSGTTLWSFKLSDKGVLTANTYGNGSQLDFRKAAMPENAPDIVQFSGRGLFKERGTDVKEIFMPETLTHIGTGASGTGHYPLQWTHECRLVDEHRLHQRMGVPRV